MINKKKKKETIYARTKIRTRNNNNKFRMPNRKTCKKRVKKQRKKKKKRRLRFKRYKRSLKRIKTNCKKTLI